MKKYLLGFLALVFPFVFFLFVDLPGAALVALGLQSTIIGWPIAAIWAFKHLSKVLEDDELKHAAATAAAAAEATVKAKAEAEAKVKAEMAAEEKVKAEAEAKVRAEMKAEAEAKK